MYHLPKVRWSISATVYEDYGRSDRQRDLGCHLFFVKSKCFGNVKRFHVDVLKWGCAAISLRGLIFVWLVVPHCSSHIGVSRRSMFIPSRKFRLFGGVRLAVISECHVPVLYTEYLLVPFVFQLKHPKCLLISPWRCYSLWAHLTALWTFGRQSHEAHQNKCVAIEQINLHSTSSLIRRRQQKTVHVSECVEFAIAWFINQSASRGQWKFLFMARSVHTSFNPFFNVLPWSFDIFWIHRGAPAVTFPGTTTIWSLWPD